MCSSAQPKMRNKGAIFYSLRSEWPIAFESSAMNFFHPNFCQQSYKQGYREGLPTRSAARPELNFQNGTLGHLSST